VKKTNAECRNIGARSEAYGERVLPSRGWGDGIREYTRAEVRNYSNQAWADGYLEAQADARRAAKKKGAKKK